MAEQLLRATKRASRTHELRKSSSSPKDQQYQSKKQQRKGDNAVRIPPSPDPCFDFKSSNSWICKNSACRATLSIDDTFCKRCSCCICHLFDDNKDPSLWLECTSESGLRDSCGLSCHIECAFQNRKVGVVNLGLLMQLDGSYCCASCGKVSGILGCWKKQLTIANDARRVDVLCYRIFLSYRLLDGTSRYNELHKFVSDAKAKLETEVGLLSGVSAKMARGIVSRLSVSAEVQTLCSLAVEKADELMSSTSTSTINSVEGSLPAACKFLFEEVTSSSVVVILIELSTTALDSDIKGYKLWYCKTREESYPKDPVSVFPRDRRRVWISNLQPCTEYSFRIISYTDTGDLGHSEAKCFTKSVEIVHRSPNLKSPENDISDNGGSSSGDQQQPRTATDIESDSGFKVRDLGRILRAVWIQEQRRSGSFCGVHVDKCSDGRDVVKVETREEKSPRQLDLNVASVPDLNEEFRDEGNGQALEADDDFSDDVRRKTGEVLGVAVAQDSDSTLTNGSPFQVQNDACLDENFEYCVKIIRWLECEGHIEKDFRLKLLTWFSLSATEQERRVVNTFIQTLIDDPSSLAGQLVDSFSDISSKRPRNGIFC